MKGKYLNVNGNENIDHINKKHPSNSDSETVLRKIISNSGCVIVCLVTKHEIPFLF